MTMKDYFKSVFSSMNPKDKAQLKKAADELFSEKGVEKVEDLWTGLEHEVPSKEAIVFGGGQAASGGGAEKMVEDYSHPAPQQAITMLYERLASEMGRKFDGVGKAVIQLQKNQSAVKEILGLLLKSEEEEEDEKEKAHEKAKDHMKKAKISLRKAESAEDEDEKEEAKDEVEKARINLKKAKDYLFKAEEEGEDEDEVEKSFTEHRKLSKKMKETKEALDKESFADWAEEEGHEKEHKKSKEEEEAKKAEEEEKERKRKEEEAAKKAENEKDKGNQAGKPSKDGNQDDAAAKAEIDRMVSLKVAEIMEGVQRQSRGESAFSFDIKKADPEAFLNAKRAAVEEAVLNDSLDLNEQTTADSILGALEKAQRGSIDYFVVEEKVRKAPLKVQRIFATV